MSAGAGATAAAPSSSVSQPSDLAQIATSTPACSLQTVAAQPEEWVSSSEASPVSMPLDAAGALPGAADTAPPNLSDAAAGMQLPPLVLTDAAAAQRDNSWLNGSSLNLPAPGSGPGESLPMQPQPEVPAQQAHMTALAHAEELECSLLTGRVLLTHPQCLLVHICIRSCPRPCSVLWGSFEKMIEAELTGFRAYRAAAASCSGRCEQARGPACEPGRGAVRLARAGAR